MQYQTTWNNVYSATMPILSLSKLVNRKLLRISGPDCYPYLQGLICNDLRYLYEPERIPKRRHAISTSNVLSAFMLNAQGRAICDMMIYRTPSTRTKCEFTPPGKATEPDELLIECDASLASGLANTLYGYRVRRKITVSMHDDLSVYCLYPNLEPGTDITNQTPLLLGDDQNDLREVMSDNLIVVNDPRLISMGMRIISKDLESNNIISSIQRIINSEIRETTHKSYTYHRYLLGVGEGLKDHPESNCFPLECNAEYLGSVSFTKGCYLGQELTSRIHHTGVVRKRLMPLQLDLASMIEDPSGPPLAANSDIVEEGTLKKIGILRHVTKDRGLALMRTELATNSDKIIHQGTKTRIITHTPYWWNLAD